MDRFKVINTWLIIYYVILGLSSSEENLNPTNNFRGSKVSDFKIKDNNNNNNNNNQNLGNLTYSRNTNARYYPPNHHNPEFQASPQYLQSLQAYQNPNLNPYHQYLPPYNNYPNGLSPPNTIPSEKGLLFPLPITHYPTHFPDAKPTTPFLPQNVNPNNFQQQAFGGFYPTNPGYFNPANFLPGSNGPHFGSHYQPPFDIGSLSKQVRFPGNPTVHIDPDRRIVKIICEFPRYLILMQAIYWHFRYNDPYGTYFDSQNGFAPNVIVEAVDQWKSVLTIHEYTEDDFGIYRCLSTAILPSNPGQHNLVDLLQLSTRTTPAVTLPSSASSATTSAYDATLYDYDSKGSQFNNQNEIKLDKKPRRSRIMKFPSSRKRSITQLSENLVSDDDDNDQVVGASTNFHSNTDEMYDLFEQNKRATNNLQKQENLQQTQDSFVHNIKHPNPPNNIRSTNANTFIPQLHLGRHIPGITELFGNNYEHNIGFIATRTPKHHYPHFPPLPQPPLIGLHAPYYKPTYGIVSIFQEVSFPLHPGIFRSRKGISSKNVLNILRNPTIYSNP